VRAAPEVGQDVAEQVRADQHVECVRARDHAGRHRIDELLIVAHLHEADRDGGEDVSQNTMSYRMLCALLFRSEPILIIVAYPWAPGGQTDNLALSRIQQHSIARIVPRSRCLRPWSRFEGGLLSR
jgi:hypothetical protein